MKKILSALVLMSLAGQMHAADERGSRSIIINSSSIGRVVTLFREIAALRAPPGSSTASTTCGYIFPGDSGKFGCKGSGRAAADVAAACSGGGQLACTGSGSNRTCTCAFD